MPYFYTDFFESVLYSSRRVGIYSSYLYQFGVSNTLRMLEYAYQKYIIIIF